MLVRRSLKDIISVTSEQNIKNIYYKTKIEN